jgi:ribose-phosphate pyrophosphokinase
VQAARAYRAAGATKVHAIASHLVLPGDAADKLQASGVFASILGTDSHPGSQKLPKESVVTIAPRLVECLEASSDER